VLLWQQKQQFKAFKNGSFNIKLIQNTVQLFVALQLLKEKLDKIKSPDFV
jgi:hypothetical protein